MEPLPSNLSLWCTLNTLNKEAFAITSNQGLYDQCRGHILCTFSCIPFPELSISTKS